MRKAPLFLLLIATVTFVSFVSDVEAKNRDKSWEFGIFVTHLDGDRSADIENSMGAQVSFGFNFSAKIELELTLAQNRFEFEEFDRATTNALTDVGALAISEPLPARDETLNRAIFNITGNFLTDRETRMVPYVSGGLGVVQETRDGFPLLVNIINPADPNGQDPNIPDRIDTQIEVNETFDSSAVLTLAAGARTFLTDNWGIRYELRYFHHDSFGLNQDDYQIAVGATWVVGGQK